MSRRNKALVKELSTPPPGAKDLYFPTQYSQSTWGQFKSCIWKQWWTYWRSPDYNLVRFFFTLTAALLVGTIFWKVGTKTSVCSSFSLFKFSMTTIRIVQEQDWKSNKMFLLCYRKDRNDLTMVIGAMYAAVVFLGVNNCSTVQPVVAIERTVFYRERAAGMYSALPYAIAQVRRNRQQNRANSHANET